MSKAVSAKLLRTLALNWQAEMTGHHTYAALAEREADPARLLALRHMAAAEKHHADLWAERFHALGGRDLIYTGGAEGEAGNLATRVGGDALALRRLELDESRDIARYGRQLREFGDQPAMAILQEVIADEQQHYHALGNLVRERGSLPPLTPEQARTALNDVVAAREHGRAGRWAGDAGWVADAIYGVNDGLGSIFGIVSGVSGATVGNSRFVLIAGLAGMVASALSMGSGAYLAAKSQREIFAAEYAREREAVELNEPEAREILSLSFQVRGLSPEDADRFVEHMARDRAQLVEALARERLDTTADALKQPLTAAVSGALSTAVGAFVPIIPFFFLSGLPAILVAAAVSLVAHFAVGAAKSLITIRSWWSSGLEMTAVGALEGAVTYAIGLGLGRLAA